MEIEDDFKKMALDHIQNTKSKYYFGLLVVPLCVYLAYTREANQAIQATWLFSQWIVGILILATILSANPSAKSKPINVNIDKLLPTLFMLSGILWGLAAFVFNSKSTKSDTAYLYVICIGFISAVIIPGILWNLLFYMLATPILISLTLNFLFETHYGYFWLALAVLMYSYVMIDGVSKQRKLVVFSLEMQKANKALIRDLEKQKEIAILANENKTKFLAAASHDLRQPLHAIGLFCETLSLKTKDSECRELVTSIKEAAASSNSYLSALLDISKLDAGAYKPKLQPIDLSIILNKISCEFALQANQKGLVCNVQADPYWIESDPTFLEIILRNLMSNAIRYTDAGGITLRCIATKDQIQISVIDTGIGIPPEFHQKIFHEFWQLDNPERDSSKGVGLGLSTVDRFCRFLNIGLTLDSQVGKGSTFTLTLPRCHSTIEKLSVVNGQKLNCPTPAQKILLLENHKDSRIATAVLLSSWGYEACVSGSLTDARKDYLSKGIYPDIVLTDFALSSDMNGIEVLSILEQEVRKRFVGIILTGESSPQGLEKLKQCDYRVLFKPVPAVKLRSAIVSAGIELDTVRSETVRY